MIANRVAQAYVQALKPFRGSHLYAEFVNGFYVVYSYGPHFPLWARDPNGIWIENIDRYSRSTSRHYTQTNPNKETFRCGTAQLRDIIAGRMNAPRFAEVPQNGF